MSRPVFSSIPLELISTDIHRLNPEAPVSDSSSFDLRIRHLCKRVEKGAEKNKLRKLTTFPIILEGDVDVGLAGCAAHLTLAGVVARVAGAEGAGALMVSVAGARRGALAVVRAAIGRRPALRARPTADSTTRIRHV